MAINLTDNNPRIEYTVAQGVTESTAKAIPFIFFNAETDIRVYVDNVQRSFSATTANTTQFTVTGGNGSTGSFTTTVTGATGGSTIVVTREISLDRTSDFQPTEVFNANPITTLNTQLDRLTAIQADFNDEVTRAIALSDSDPAASMVLPTKANRLGKTLGFHPTTGAVQMFTPQSLTIGSDSGSGSIDLTFHTLTFTGGVGIETSISNQEVTIAGELASTSNKGVASFNSTNFTVSSGVVSAKDITLSSNSGSATNSLGETFTLSGGVGLTTSATGSTVTIDGTNATTSNKGVASFDSNYFAVSNGEVSLNTSQTNIHTITNSNLKLARNTQDFLKLINGGIELHEGLEGEFLEITGNTTTVNVRLPSTKAFFNILGKDPNNNNTIQALTLNMGSSGDATFNNDVAIGGNLTVSGTTTTTNTTTLSVQDPLIELAKGNTSNNSDIGFYGVYSTNHYAGLFRDATDSKFKLFNNLQAEPQTTVNTGGTGYAVGTLVANLEGNVTGTIQTASQPNITSLGTLTTLTVDDITINDSTISDSGDLTIDVGGVINLESAFGETRFERGGTEFFRIQDSSDDVILKPVVDGKDIIFQQRDGTEVARVKDNGTFNVVTDKLAINGTAITATANELNYTDITTLGTVQASKALTADANGDVTFPTTSRLTLKTNSAQNPAVVIEGTGPNELLFAGDTSASTIANKKVDGVSLLYRTTPNDLEIIRSETSGLLAKFSNGNPTANPATTPRVELYHNNVKKLETTANGVTVDGLKLEDNKTITFGTDDDATIRHFTDGNNENHFEIDNNTGILKLFSVQVYIQGQFGAGDETMAQFSKNGPVKLYFDNVEKITTASTGATISGTLEATTGLRLTNGVNSLFKIESPDGTRGYQLKANISNSADFGFLIENLDNTDIAAFKNGGETILTHGATLSAGTVSSGVTLSQDTVVHNTRLKTTSTGLDVFGSDTLNEGDSGGTDNTCNIRLVAEGVNEILTLRASDGVGAFISRNGNAFGTHLFQAFDGSTTNYLQLTNTGHTSYRDLTLDGASTDLIFDKGTYTTTLTTTNPSSQNQTVTLPDASGTINELLISSGSVSNVSSIDFNSSILTTEFSSYRLVLLNVKPDTDNVNFSFRVGTSNSADTGANYSQANFRYGVWNNNGSSANSSINNVNHADTHFKLAYSHAALGTGTGENGHFEIELLNANSTSCYKQIGIEQRIYSHFPVAYGSYVDSAVYRSNSAINFLTAFVHVGNIASADFRLYGVK